MDSKGNGWTWYSISDRPPSDVSDKTINNEASSLIFDALSKLILRLEIHKDKKCPPQYVMM